MLCNTHVPAYLRVRSHVVKSPPYPEISFSRLQDDTCSTSKLILYNLMTVSFLNNYSVKRSKKKKSRKPPFLPLSVPAFLSLHSVSHCSIPPPITGQCQSYKFLNICEIQGLSTFLYSPLA